MSRGLLARRKDTRRRVAVEVDLVGAALGVVTAEEVVDPHVVQGHVALLGLERDGRRWVSAAAATGVVDDLVGRGGPFLGTGPR